MRNTSLIIHPPQQTRHLSVQEQKVNLERKVHAQGHLSFRELLVLQGPTGEDL